MIFYLQFRDAPSDGPIIEFQSPLPLPVPRVGERVQLFEGTTPLVIGKVESVEWAYQPRPQDGDVPDLDIAARVWLTKV